MRDYTKKNFTLDEWNKLSREEQCVFSALVRPTNDEELKAYIWKFFGMKIPETCHPDCAKKSVPCTPPFKIFSDAYFGRYDMIILKASRGSGKSVLLALLALTEQISLNAEVIILAASELQAKLVFGFVSQKTTRFAGKFWAHPNAPKALQNTKEELMERSRIVTGGQIKCLAASQTSILGQRPTRLRIDEADVLDLELIDFALPCVFPHPTIKEVKGQTLIASTHYRAKGTLSDLIVRAEASNREAGHTVVPIYSFCYKDVLESNGGHITDDQVATWKTQMPKHIWIRQYENGEPAFDEGLFKAQDIDFMFDADLGTYEGDPDEIIPSPMTHWEDGEEGYYHGTDFGDKVDWTIISTFIASQNEDKPDRFVSWLRKGRCGLKVSARAYDQKLIDYPGVAAHDGTGSSQFVAEELTEYSEPVVWTKKFKQENMTKLVVAIEQHRLKMPKIKWLEKQVRFLTYDEAFGTKHLPDGVASLLMAWYARQRVMKNLNIGGIHY